MTTPYPWQPQPGDPRPPEPTPPPPGIDQATRSPIGRAICAALIVFAAMLFTATPASAHGGDGRRASCDIGGAREAFWGCGTAHTYSIGQTRYAEVWFQDSHNDGHCVEAIAVNAWTQFQIARACSLGRNEHKVLRLNLSAPFTRVYIKTPHRYMTLCGPGSGRSC
jgi:hypothetical protein